MKKLALDLDSIEVTSFDLGGAAGSPGTVHANADTSKSCNPPCPNTVMDNSCEMSCAPSCASITCGWSCDPSCMSDCDSCVVSCVETCLC